MNQISQTKDNNEFRTARKFIKTLLQTLGEDQEGARMREMLGVAVKALLSSELQRDNPPLTWEHLKQMHGYPVFYDNGSHTGGEWGFVDTRNDTIRVLDHDGSTWAREFPRSRTYGAQVYRYATTGGDVE